MSLSSFLKPNNTTALILGAGAVGVVAAFVLSKANIGSMKSMANNTINDLANSHPLAAEALATHSGMKPRYSRAFPHNCFLKDNSVPSPSVENLVPFDSSGLYAKVSGVYDGCDNNLF